MVGSHLTAVFLLAGMITSAGPLTSASPLEDAAPRASEHDPQSLHLAVGRWTPDPGTLAIECEEVEQVEEVEDDRGPAPLARADRGPRTLPAIRLSALDAWDSPLRGRDARAIHGARAPPAI